MGADGETERRGLAGRVRDRLSVKPAPAAWFRDEKAAALVEGVAAAVGVGAEDVVRAVESAAYCQ
jgi:hypothetical protein